MATFVLTDATIWAHDLDMSGISNQVSLTPSADAVDATTFGSGGYRTKRGGLKMVDSEVAGFWDATPDSQMFASLGIAERAVTITPTGVAGARAFFFQAGVFDYEAFGSVGDMNPFSASLSGTNGVGLVRGLLTGAKANVSATGQFGSIEQVGAGGAGKFLYAVVHVFTAGTTITLQVQSDDSGGFGTPTTQATIGPLTTTGGTFMTRVDASAITDSFWRFNVSAITGTFNIAGAIAVQ